MLALIFDTETTGLPTSAPLDHESQPDVVQIAGILADKTTVYGQFNFIVKTDKQIPDKVAAIHGISNEMVQKYGVPRKVVLNVLNSFLKKADIVVAHNVDFDLKLTRIMFAKQIAEEFNASGIAIPMVEFPTPYCTMKSSTDICKIPDPRFGGKLKWPKLIEAFKILVDPQGFDGAHNAMVDVMACYEVWKRIHNGSPVPL